MRAVVLVKQVPDLRASSVSLRPDGTIDRGAAKAIVNPVDLHAVEAAVQLADDVWAVSMGPMKAAEALREAIAHGAHRCLLLCDRLLAGSDTWATANALAAAVRHIGGVDLVICGLSALDGETGQVGPEVACRLGWPQATGCEEAAVDDAAKRLTVRRIVEGGYERLSLPLPTVITVAETGFLPRYPSVTDRRRAARAEVEVIGTASLGLVGSQVGLEASPTKVARMETVPLPDCNCRLVGDDFTLDDMVSDLVHAGALTARSSITPAAQPLPLPPAIRSRTGEACVWVVCETHGSELARCSEELLSKGAELASELEGGLAAFVAVDRAAPAVDQAAFYGADIVFVAAQAELRQYRCEPYAAVLRQLFQPHPPQAVLFSATTTGRDLAPRVAAGLDTGLAADCTDLAIGEWRHRDVTYRPLLMQLRPAMAGSVLATCVCPTARPQMATVRPGTFEPRARPRKARVELVEAQFAPEELAVQVLGRQISSGPIDLREADVVVAGGHGCDAHTWPLVEELAAVIGGKVAATRAAVEAGLAPRSLQVGQTGISVRPRLYIGCGVSGSLQHTVGMKAASHVVAINRDPAALLFRLADYGVVGEISDVLPRLTAAFGRANRGPRPSGSGD